MELEHDTITDHLNPAPAILIRVASGELKAKLAIEREDLRHVPDKKCWHQ